MPYLQFFFYGFTLWLGAYLLARGSHRATVNLTGWGLLAYALALAVQILFRQAFLIILLAPALFWIGAALFLLPEDGPARPVLIRTWAMASIPLAILTQLNAWFAALILLALLVCAVLIGRLALQARAAAGMAQAPGPLYKNTLALLAAVALFVGLSSGLLILPLNWIPLDWAMALLGLDLLLLGVTITAWDAFDEGAAIRAHLARSFIAALYYAGALALIAALFNAGLSLLLVLITFGILTQAFSNPIQAWLDRLVLPQPVNAQRQELRQAAEDLPLLSPEDPLQLDEEQFARLTRRALSNLGDLPKLATSPLIHLPDVQGSNPLDRAHALKALLIRHIHKLKPQSNDGFGASDEWRFYNAIYFPYVLGLKPYTRRADYNSLDSASRAALEWFQAYVPERTLHNWQNTAARLIAEQLRRQTG